MKQFSWDMLSMCPLDNQICMIGAVVVILKICTILKDIIFHELAYNNKNNNYYY